MGISKQKIHYLNHHSPMILFTQLYKKINNDKEIINNIDVGSLLQHLNGVIGVLRNRTGE